MSLRSSHPKIGRVVHIAREFGPVAGAGGIKDVTWGLCKATADTGIAVDMFLPHYRKADDYLAHNGLKAKHVDAFSIPMNYVSYTHHEAVEVSACEIRPNLMLYLVKGDPFRYLAEAPKQKIPRHGIYQYTRAEAEALGQPGFEGQGYADAFAQNVLLVKAALMILGRTSKRPDLVHCHDGHAALFPLIAQASGEGYAPYLAHLPTLLTIHNAGKGYHQETRSLAYAQAICGMTSPEAKTIAEQCVLGDAFDPLLAGGVFGTAVNTVSENYARELRETGLDAKTGWLGHAYRGFGIDLLGMTNGIDVDSNHPNNPEREGLPTSFSPEKEEWRAKETCKKKSIEQLRHFKAEKDLKKYGSLTYRSGEPLLTFVGRLTVQKGFDDLCEALGTLMKEDTAFSIWGLGNGDPAIVKKCIVLTKKFKNRVCFIEGFSEENAHRVFSSGDFFLIPSQYEPCGLTDFIAQLNGNIPIVHRVGGLVKTVDGKTGFSYLGGADELLQVMKRALKVYRSPEKKQLRTIQRGALKNIHTHFTWDKVLARSYLPLYERVIKKAAPTSPLP